MLTRLNLQITEELDVALRKLASAGDGRSLGPLVESLLWRSKSVRDAATAAKVSNPKRLRDGRGTYERASK